MTFQTWHFKKKTFTSLHSYLKRSMPETLFGTLTNLLYSFQKNLPVRTLIIQKPVKWFPMQNSWLVSKPYIFSVKGISKQTLTHFQPMFHLNKPASWFLIEIFLKKHLWKKDILSQDVGLWPISLFKMSLYHRYFLAFFASKSELSDFFLCGILRYWLNMSSVRFYIHYAFISHTSESNLYWVSLHVISRKGNSLAILFSFFFVFFFPYI